MVAVPQITTDPTLDALDAVMVEESRREKRRLYLGMSGIGRPCAREQWYNFRWALRVEFGANTLRAFADGFCQEDVAAERLRKVPGVTLITADPATGRQFRYEDFGGHFMGHMDGHIEGIYQAPKTPHVWEHKSVNEKKFAKLESLAASLGKMALQQWDATYYAQGVLYMDYGGYARHYLTCSTPGGRQYTSVRTKANPVEAQRLRDKAERIIFSDDPPERIGGPDFYQCRRDWCGFAGICHHGEAADRNCRTCTHSTPRREGGWTCDLTDSSEAIGPQLQAEGCTSHRYLPTFVPGEPIDADQAENWIDYLMPDGSTWRDNG